MRCWDPPTPSPARPGGAWRGGVGQGGGGHVWGPGEPGAGRGGGILNGGTIPPPSAGGEEKGCVGRGKGFGAMSPRWGAGSRGIPTDLRGRGFRGSLRWGGRDPQSWGQGEPSQQGSRGSPAGGPPPKGGPQRKGHHRSRRTLPRGQDPRGSGVPTGELWGKTPTRLGGSGLSRGEDKWGGMFQREGSRGRIPPDLGAVSQ